MFNALIFLSVSNTGISSCQILTHIGIIYYVVYQAVIVKLMFGVIDLTMENGAMMLRN